MSEQEAEGVVVSFTHDPVSGDLRFETRSIHGGTPVTPEEQREADILWLQDEVRGESFEGNTPRADRYRRILAVLSAQQEPRAWECRACAAAMEWAVTLCERCPFVPREAGIHLYARNPATVATPPQEQATSP